MGPARSRPQRPEGRRRAVERIAQRQFAGIFSQTAPSLQFASLVAQAAEIFARLNALAAKQRWPTECDATLAFDRPELRALLEIWRTKAGDGVPSRSAFDMSTLKSLASHVFILERSEAGEVRSYKFRLFGSALLQLFGEHTGRPLDNVVTPEMLSSWLAIYDGVLEARQPLRIVTHFLLASSGFLKGEMLAAPMTDDAGDERMILGATYVSPANAVPSPFE